MKHMSIISRKIRFNVKHQINAIKGIHFKNLDCNPWNSGNDKIANIWEIIRQCKNLTTVKVEGGDCYKVGKRLEYKGSHNRKYLCVFYQFENTLLEYNKMWSKRYYTWHYTSYNPLVIKIQ